MSTKSKQRQHLRQQRLQLTPSVIQQKAERVATHIINVDEFLDAKYIAIYMAQEGEVDTTKIINMIWRAQKYCYLPIVADAEDKQLAFCRYAEADKLIENRYGILEPALPRNERRAAQELDLVLMPLVGFDRKGHRLGRGAGYYDHTFEFLLQEPKPKRPKLIGIAYDFQCIDHVDVNEWDVGLDVVVTESEVIRV